jgi:hypothetical protein
MATVETIDARLIVLETEFRTELKHLATKADLKDLEVSLGGRIGDLEVSLGGRIGDLEVSLGGRIDQVDARIDKLEARMVKWAVGLLVAIAGVGVGLALLIQRAL